MQLHILNNLDLRDANWTSVVLLQPRTNAITVTSLVVEHVTTRVERDHLGAASDVGLANAARLMKCFFDWTALELFQSRANSTGCARILIHETCTMLLIHDFAGDLE